MILNAVIEGQTYPIEVADYVIEEGREFFDKMDRDMDQGWQMGRTWVEDLTLVNRCQIAADKLLTALETDNKSMQILMAGYILSHAPGVMTVYIDTTGDMMSTELEMGPSSR